MKKNILWLTIILWLLPLGIHAQTIVVDPDTYEIRIIEEDTTTAPTPLLEENELDTEQELQDTAAEIVEELEEIQTPPTVTTTVKSSSLSEFEQALQWMYDNQMTIFNDTDRYEPFNQLTRGQFAKMVNRFSLVEWHNRSIKNTSCNFIDINEADPTLQPHIIETCKVGIFKWYQDGSFKPNKKLTKAEALAVMLRIANGKRLDESLNPRRSAYYDQASKRWITNEKNSQNLEQVINRYLVALYMYRLHIAMNPDERDDVVIIEETPSIPEPLPTETSQLPVIMNITKQWDTIIDLTISSENEQWRFSRTSDGTYTLQE